MREQAAQVERAGQPVDTSASLMPSSRTSRSSTLRVDVLLDLEPHRRAEAAAQQLLLQRGEQVLGVVLLDLEVLVAGDAEGVVLQHLHAGEELVEVARDDVLERHEALALDSAEPPRRRRAEQVGGTLTRAKCSLPVCGLRTQHGEVERQAGDVGERVRRVDGQRREHREDPVARRAAERLAAPRRSRSSQRTSVDALVRRAPGAPRRWKTRGVPLHAARGRPRRSARAPRGAQPGGGAHGEAGGDAALEAGHADHEELVEVAGEDGQEAGPLEQRHGRVLGELEHPLVELQPGQLAVEEAVGRQVVLVVALSACADEPPVGGTGGDAPVGDGAGERADLGCLARRTRRPMRRGSPQSGRPARRASGLVRLPVLMRPSWHRKVARG